MRLTRKQKRLSMILSGLAVLGVLEQLRSTFEFTPARKGSTGLGEAGCHGDGNRHGGGSTREAEPTE